MEALLAYPVDLVTEDALRPVLREQVVQEVIRAWRLAPAYAGDDGSAA